MIRTLSRTLMICTLLACSSSALAVYKCESNGKIAYSEAPCADGKGIDMGKQVASNDDASEAEKRAAQDKKELSRLENARHKREAAEEREHQRIVRANAAKQKKCQSLAQRRKWAAEDASKATMKAAEKAKLKLRRMDEKIELECG